MSNSKRGGTPSPRKRIKREEDEDDGVMVLRSSVERSYCTAGPCTSIHYQLPNLRQAEEILKSVKAGHYIYISAPRQAGKTTAANRLAESLTQSGSYCAVRLSLAAARGMTDTKAAIRAILESWDRDIRLTLSHELQKGMFLMSLYTDKYEAAVTEALRRWSELCSLPVVIFLDDLSCVNESVRTRILNGIQQGFTHRPKHFPHSIVFMGEEARLPAFFNIVQETVALKNFNRKEIEVMCNQHTAATGQCFATDAMNRIHGLSQGQPWVVNAFLSILTQQVVPNCGTTIGAVHVTGALESMIERMDPFLQNVVDAARHKMYKHILTKLAANQSVHSDPANLEKLVSAGILCKKGDDYELTCYTIFCELIRKHSSSK